MNKSIKKMKAVLLIAVLYFSTLPIAVVNANDAKAGMDAERLARIPARMKAFVDKGTPTKLIRFLNPASNDVPNPPR